jgi:hypothetical protein
VRLLAVLWLALGALRLVTAVVIYSMGQFIFAFVPMPMMPAHLFGGIVTLVASFFLLQAILALVAGWALFEFQPWARMFALVMGFLALLLPPVGTALGIYTLWVLLPEQSEREYRALVQVA